MKFLDDIMQAISGNTKTKIEDPFIGAFIGSWIVCNWEHLAILMWGDGNAAERINALSKYFKDTHIFELNTVLTIPLLMTLLFLFVFPWASLLLKSLQKFANERLHQQAISIEVSKVREQEILNKQQLLADPNKKFLEQNAQLDIDRRQETIEQLKLRTFRFKQKAETAAAESEAATASAAEAKSRAFQAELEEEKKQKYAELERQRFNVESARLKSTQASNRFPSSYSFMLAIAESLKADEVQLSLTGLGEIVAMIFGYENFLSLVHDENFNNDKLSQVSCIYYDPKVFASRLESIVQNEDSYNADLESGLLFDHVISVLEDLKYKILTEDQVKDICRDACENFKYDLLNGEEFSGPISESDTHIEDIEIGELDSFTFNGGLSAVFSGSASGSHRNDTELPGRDIKFNVEIKNTVLFGTRALGKFELGEISASLIDYDYDFESEDEANSTWAPRN
ncbi:hypothetical protein A7J50_1760 [Pseudomonas antarctica]|uniref:Uncharacterized protein n=1 Tax=Pseudomonas antarctica TaxID=219572 RepID=A0A172YYK9_9PSED|nr:hypothetical protein [Pseudomonas antarctica]ANF85182.1 hypothetical protein A7J50_1760 [Pseudomonas antarctica]